MARSSPIARRDPGGTGTGRRYPGALQAEERSMSKISFDSHLIEADPFGCRCAPKWLLSACYGHMHLI